MSTYKKDFTIKPPTERPFLNPSDVLGKVADNQECCVITSGGKKICAIYNGGYFSVNARSLYVTEATPIAPENQWPAAAVWSTSDWEDLGIYPPRPVQQAILIVTMPDGTEFEVSAPFTDETPKAESAQINYHVRLETFERHIRNAYQYSHYPKVIPTIQTRWAWQDKPAVQ